MPRQEFDKSSKWMLQHHADAMLFLGGLRDVRQWKALQAELTKPRNLPDGLIEVYLGNRKKPDHFLIEVATYPENRVMQQALDDLKHASLILRVVPELLVIVLHPRGKINVERSMQERSRLGWSELAGKWNVVELWKLRAEDLLAAGNVGLIPWLPLTQFEGQPETLLEQCRERIEREAPAKEQADLLAVSQVLARLRFPRPEMLALLGGKKLMIESPLIQELLAEQQQKSIIGVLRRRFKIVPPEITLRIQQIGKLKNLEQLHEESVDCPNLEAFLALLSR